MVVNEAHQIVAAEFRAENALFSGFEWMFWWREIPNVDWNEMKINETTMPAMLCSDYGDSTRQAAKVSEKCGFNCQ